MLSDKSHPPGTLPPENPHGHSPIGYRPRNLSRLIPQDILGHSRTNPGHFLSEDFFPSYHHCRHASFLRASIQGLKRGRRPHPSQDRPYSPNWLYGFQTAFGFFFSTIFTALHGVRRALAMRILSVCPSVCLSKAWFVTKRKKVVHAFLYRMKEHLSQFCDKKNGWWGGF